MADAVFIIALLGYMGLATVLMYRSPTHGWGFPMFVLLYPVFMVAYFIASSEVVLLTWLGFALVNMVVQYFYMRSEGIKKGLAGVMIGSLLLWPVQFAAAINSAETGKAEQANRQANRAKIGALPATIDGTVSYTHHHGTEEGHDSVWLEEYGDLSFMTDSQTYDRIAIAEGKRVSLTIDEREAPEGFDVGAVLWIVDGESDSS